MITAYKNLNAQALWMALKAVKVNEDNDHIEYRFKSSKLSYKMVIRAIFGNEWERKCEYGQGWSHNWTVSTNEGQDENYKYFGIHYYDKKNYVEFTLMVAKPGYKS